MKRSEFLRLSIAGVTLVALLTLEAATLATTFCDESMRFSARVPATVATGSTVVTLTVVPTGNCGGLRLTAKSPLGPVSCTVWVATAGW